MSGMKRETILVVDDHAEVAKALVALVRDFGYEASAAYNGQKALEQVRADPPALMLLDLQMRGVSGYDVLRALRAERRFDRLPVVVCSAASSPQVRDEVMRLGAQDFVAKDDAAEELEGAIARQLDGQKAGAGATRAR